MNRLAGAPAIGAPKNQKTDMRDAVAACKGAFGGVALMSGMLNLLYLTGSFFMLEIYDRVLPSRSVPTLVGLAVIAATLYAFQGAIDIIRGRILARIGTSIDDALSAKTFQAVTRLPLMSGNSDSIQPSRDLDVVRSFLSGTGPVALCDLPWMPLYLTICFIFHPAIGWAATIGGLILVVLTLLTETYTKRPVQEASQLNNQRNALSEVFRRNAETLKAMGMEARMGVLWGDVNSNLKTAQLRAADVTTGLGSASKVMRMMLQSGVLAIGAYLVINQEATAGIIIASSILTSRALAPIEQVISQWKGFVAARQSWHRLEGILHTFSDNSTPLKLPTPAQALQVENVSVAAPGGRALIVQDVTFNLEAGQGLGIIGPSASGKSSLVRAIVGAWTPVRGTVRLDGAALQQWPSEQLGRHVGYLPQDVQLFSGTIAQNIARFDPESTPEQVIAAAQIAGVHDMIVRLPGGYNAPVGENGQALSAGQRQRVGLARAIYGNPFLVVLDEPNSNLDVQGEEALTRAISSVRANGGIVVVVAHRPSALAAVNVILMMVDGRAQHFGPKEQVLGKVLIHPSSGSPAPSVAAPSTMKSISPTSAGAAR